MPIICASYSSIYCNYFSLLLFPVNFSVFRFLFLFLFVVYAFTISNDYVHLVSLILLFGGFLLSIYTAGGTNRVVAAKRYV